MKFIEKNMRNMKQEKLKKRGKTGMLILFCTLTALSGCGKAKEPTEEIEPETELMESFISPELESLEVEEEKVFGVTYEDSSQGGEDKDGTILVKANQNKPYVTLPEWPEAQEKINAFFAEQTDAFESTLKEYTEWAAEDREFREKTREEEETGEETALEWTPYTLDRQYQNARFDDTILSFIQKDSEYTGGAHPNTVHTTLNFDTKTGERLNLADVVKDESEAMDFVNSYLVDALLTTIGEEGLFEDYATSVFDILTDTTWYLNEEGFVIIVNEYIVSPHSSGINEITIPYGEAEFLKEEYRM